MSQTYRMNKQTDLRKQTVLVLGAGNLESEVVFALADTGCHIVRQTYLSTRSMDVGEIQQTLFISRPDAIVIAHLPYNPELSAKDPDAARSLIVELPLRWAGFARRFGCKLILLSSGTVMAGCKSQASLETDKANPVDKSGSLFLECEKTFLEAAAPPGHILRLGVPFDFGSDPLRDKIVDYVGRFGITGVPDYPAVSIVRKRTVGSAVRALILEETEYRILHVAENEILTPRAIAIQMAETYVGLKAAETSPQYSASAILPSVLDFRLDTTRLESLKHFRRKRWWEPGS